MKEDTKRNARGKELSNHPPANLLKVANEEEKGAKQKGDEGIDF